MTTKLTEQELQDLQRYAELSQNMRSTTKVKNMTSTKGNFVPNQFVIYTSKGKYFQSYNSIIALIDNSNNVFLDSYYWNYSRTTAKYRNIFLDELTPETKGKIKSGEHKLVDLN